MAKAKVFIDGSAGTTGLRIRERLAARDDIELVVLAEEERKDVEARRAALDVADIAFLCLPDQAAIEAAELVANPRTVVIDTSTAHRVADGWEYGFPELAGRRERIARARRIANPGCHASGFIALVAPLVAAGILPADAPIAAFSLTGYSGGGKKMIADYEEKLAAGSMEYLGGRQYALAQTHKHLPEMVKICALSRAPVFSPVIVPHVSGMQTSVLLQGASVAGGIAAVSACYASCYGEGAGGVVRFAASGELPGVLSSAMLSGRDDMLVTVHGNDDRIVLTALFDNLGKGASGAAIQNMNIAMGVDERKGLATA